jgi:hypothetical protein
MRSQIDDLQSALSSARHLASDHADEEARLRVAINRMMEAAIGGDLDEVKSIGLAALMHNRFADKPPWERPGHRRRKAGGADREA